jgi:hypothetical protein
MVSLYPVNISNISLSIRLCLFASALVVFIPLKNAEAETLYYHMDLSSASLRIEATASGFGFIQERDFEPGDRAHFWVNMDTWETGFKLTNSGDGELISEIGVPSDPKLRDEVFASPVELGLTTFGYEDYWLEYLRYTGTSYRDSDHPNLPIDFLELQSDPRELFRPGIWNAAAHLASHLSETAGGLGWFNYPTLRLSGQDLLLYGNYLVSRLDAGFSGASATDGDLRLLYSVTGMASPRFVGTTPGDVPEPFTAVLLLTGLIPLALRVGAGQRKN